MSRFRTSLTGRAALRQQKREATKRKGAGWTRSFRKGRTQRLPRQEEAP